MFKTSGGLKPTFANSAGIAFFASSMAAWLAHTAAKPRCRRRIHIASEPAETWAIGVCVPHYGAGLAPFSSQDVGNGVTSNLMLRSASAPRIRVDLE